MTKIGKRLAAVFLAVAMVVTFMPVLGTQTAYAADAYNLYIGDTQVTSDNAGDILGDGTFSYSGDSAQGTLTMNNASLTTGAKNIFNSTTNISSNNIDLTIDVTGSNSLSGAQRSIAVSNGDLTFEGSGSLDITSESSSIQTSNKGNIVIRGAFISANNTSFGNAVSAFNDIIVESGNLTVQAYRFGIGGSNYTQQDGAVSVTAKATAISIGGDITIDGGTLSAINDGTINGYGIYAQKGTITFNNGLEKVTAKGGQAAISAYDFTNSKANGTITFGEDVRVREPVGGTLSTGDSYVCESDGETAAKETVISASVTIPKGKSLSYTGSEQDGIPENEYYTASGNIATVVGSYTATLSLKDKTNLIWRDGTTEDKTVNWEIVPAKVSIPTGKTLTFNNKEQTGLTVEEPYTVTGNAATNVGSYEAVASLKDKTNYIWSDGTTEDKTVNWEIVPAKVSIPTGKTLTYTGKTQTGVPSGTGYTVSGTKSAANAGTYKATVTPDAGYCWADGTTEDKTISWKINKKAITPAVTLSASAYTYNGKVQKPTVTVKDGSTKLATSQYDITYTSGRKNVGTYKVTVKMKGNYSGSKTVSFKINPKGTTLSKVTKAKKAATVKWKKQAAKMSTSRITGYQIQMATDSKFTKNKKTVNVKGYSKTSKKVTGLKGGKKYWVRIRTYKKVGSTTYYSPWSKAKTVTTGK